MDRIDNHFCTFVSACGDTGSPSCIHAGSVSRMEAYVQY